MKTGQMEWACYCNGQRVPLFPLPSQCGSDVLSDLTADGAGKVFVLSDGQTFPAIFKLGILVSFPRQKENVHSMSLRAAGS